jgi:pimeloyl-ACP methyl ester carboxylesterase
MHGTVNMLARRQFLPVLLIAMSSTGAGARDLVPRFETTECPFAVDVDPGIVRCGNLLVAENRQAAGGRTLRLSVAIIKSTAENSRPDPLVFLSGGPGDASVTRVPDRIHSSFWNRFRSNRDLIFFDQRGTGFSEPRFCPELDVALYTAAFRGLSVEEQRRFERESVVACKDKMLAQGIDFSAYNSKTSALDLDELRQALGYEEWNLFGASYGTRLALTAMRDTPDGIRSIVLDSVSPPNAPYGDDNSRLMRSLRLVFDQCAAEPRCRAAFPSLEEDFFSVLEDLERHPMHLTMADKSRFPDGHLVVDGSVLAAGVFQGLYFKDFVPFMPLLVRETKKRNISVVEALAENLVSDPSEMSQGLFYAVDCYEYIPFGEPAAIAEDRARYPRLAPFQEFQDNQAICDAWHHERADPRDLQPVYSEIPTLIAAGEFDPITPPAYGRLAAESLSNATYFEVPGASHGATPTNDCTRAIMQAFLDDPGTAPDTRCVTSIKRAEFITDAYVNPGIYRLLRHFQAPVNVGALTGVGLMALLVLSALVVWPYVWLRRRFARNKLPEESRGAKRARGLAFLASTLIAGFLLGLGWAISDAIGRSEFLPAIGVSGSVRSLFALPWLVAALTAGIAVLVVVAWRHRWWTAPHRVHYTLVAVACAGFVFCAARLGLM